MSQVTTMKDFNPHQLRIIRQTVAADTNDHEFNLFMEACRSYGLDPFRKQIHAVVYNKGNAEKRKMSIILSRDGYRVLAHRCKDYRPASEPPQIVYSDSVKDEKTNPYGIVSATVRLWKQDNRGEWFPVVGEAFWDEFAPISDEWAWDQNEGRRKPTGNKSLDGNWAKMGRVMITKCAESQALRAGWPETFGDAYMEEEMQRFTADVSASEALHALETEERKAAVGGPGLLMVFDDAMKLEKVKLGDVHGRVDEFLKGATALEAVEFKARNEEALREFWAHDKAAALDLKKQFEAKENEYARSIAARGDAA